MNLYKKNQFLYTERMERRSEIKRRDINEYLEETTSGKLYLIFEPFLYTYKDLKDTFKPYKTRKQFVRDIFQLFAGIVNAATGLMMMFVVPFMVIIGLVNAISKPRSLLPALFKALVLTPLESLILMARGAFQIATSALAWLRIPLRALIGKIGGSPKIEDNAGIKSLVKEAQKMRENVADVHSTALINYTIKLKCIKAQARGQKTDIPEVAAALAQDLKNIKIYYQMFLPKQPLKEQGPDNLLSSTLTGEGGDTSTTIRADEGETSLGQNERPDSSTLQPSM